MIVLLYIALSILLVLSVWQRKNPLSAVSDLALGIVPGWPEELAASAGVPLDQYSLARVAQSEEGLSSERARIAVIYATLNQSLRTGKSVTALVTAGNPIRKDYSRANGRYGRQGVHPYASTIANPSRRNIELAGECIDGIAIDETDGSRFWDNPITQDLLAKAKPYDEITGKGYRTSDEIAARRIADGLTLHNIDGISTRFWK